MYMRMCLEDSDYTGVCTVCIVFVGGRIQVEAR